MPQTKPTASAGTKQTPGDIVADLLIAQKQKPEFQGRNLTRQEVVDLVNSVMPQGKPKLTLDERSLQVYKLYPRKVAPKDAQRAISAVLTSGVPLEELVKRTAQYAKLVSLWPNAYRYPKGRDIVPHPTTWFNRGSYNDDPKEWAGPIIAAAPVMKDYSKL